MQGVFVYLIWDTELRINLLRQHDRSVHVTCTILRNQQDLAGWEKLSDVVLWGQILKYFSFVCMWDARFHGGILQLSGTWRRVVWYKPWIWRRDIPVKRLYLPIGPPCVHSQEDIILIQHFFRVLLDIEPPAAFHVDCTLYYGVREVVAVLRRTASCILLFDWTWNKKCPFYEIFALLWSRTLSEHECTINLKQQRYGGSDII
jgi:hypothetical protein